MNASVKGGRRQLEKTIKLFCKQALVKAKLLIEAVLKEAESVH